MLALIFEKGMVTLSWYAWLALRRRVSMSAIGSVIVMGIRQPFSPGFPDLRAYGEAVLLQFRQPPGHGWRRGGWKGLPGSLRHAGQLAAVRHLAQADPAQAELA